jgi:large subunit ribosomal protein L25
MNFVDLRADVREEHGKESNKRIRDKGFVPCVIYKKGEESLSLKMDNKVLSKALHTQAGENVIIRLLVEGAKKDKERTVIVKEVQKHPIKDIILHADFQEISLTETLTVNVKITAKGEAIGVKQDEGVLE